MCIGTKLTCACHVSAVRVIWPVFSCMHKVKDSSGRIENRLNHQREVTGIVMNLNEKNPLE